MKCLRPTGRFATAPAFVAWIALVTALGTAAVAVEPQSAAHAPRPAIEATTDTLWILASEDDPWTVALAAPVAAHLRDSASGPRPLVMALSSPPTREAEWLLSLAAGPRPIVLATSNALKLGSALHGRSPELLQVGSDASVASAIVAKRFWNHSPEVVVAMANDPEAVILGSALAAGLDVPILLCEQEEAGAAVSAAVRDLSVVRMLVAVSDLKKTPRWIGQQSVAHEILSPRALQHQLILALGSERVRNVVVARAPDDRAEAGHSAWLAAYLSSARGAPVVLTHAQGPAVAEADVRELMRRERLLPRTVTILADYASIGYRNTEVDPAGLEDDRDEPPAVLPQPVISGGTAALPGAVPAPPQYYMVRTEPFVPTLPDELATLGVGRIPLESLGDCSVFFVRGLLRERLLAHRPPRLLMIANSGATRRALPLCEAISRVTAYEFKNFGVHVDEFYGRMTDSPEILTAARSANLILYEGHLAYQDLIDAPVLRRSRAEDYPLDEEDLEGFRGPKRPVDEDADPMPVPRVMMAEPTFRHLQGPLAGLPIVVLQSCESLDDSVLWRLDELGGVALIGSMTPIHSGCGSSLLNAAMSSMLYRGGTLGETLRDAENYMFCVEELKARRGHKEQAKGVRVALSFRLWGDPELQVLPNRPGEPRQAPVRAEWVNGDTLRIDVPQSRLPEARSDRYVASMFPNSQAAGLMKTEAETMKRISPFYFFCLPLPEGVAHRGATDLEPSSRDARRVETRIDRIRCLLYVVYYPDQERPGQSFVLHLKAVPAAEQTRRPSK
ncbi:MAG: hypothetical protein ACLP9L_02125 [Thermoguttaceae bacterium]